MSKEITHNENEEPTTAFFKTFYLVMAISV